MILTAQSLAVLIFGWITRIIIRLKYNTPTSDCQLFDCGNYNLRPDFNNSKFPKNSLVLVRFNTDRTIKSEHFYTNTGDWIYVEYENGKRIQYASNPFSQLVMASFCVPGFLIITALNILNTIDWFFYIDSASLPKFLNSDVARLSLAIPWWCMIIQLFFSPLLNYQKFDDV
ncbi:hypothetical protein [Rivularia sp. PCC 7116]|uniref:hypothetical protein n=1 Tax=Rivularia sp. PCC 7116 TaxID=373994 RepID=UPI0002FD8ACD|nr:hypothetical protein [Rivularia sp. PCC 7116]